MKRYDERVRCVKGQTQQKMNIVKMGEKNGINR